jgi:hypothetical protein
MANRARAIQGKVKFHITELEENLITLTSREISEEDYWN